MTGKLMRLVQLLHFLEPLILDVSRMDSQVWRAKKDGKFSVKSCYGLLQKQISHWDLTWPWKLLWKSQAPLKVACFGWLQLGMHAQHRICCREEEFLCAVDASYVKTLRNLQITYFCTVITQSSYGISFLTCVV